MDKNNIKLCLGLLNKCLLFYWVLVALSTQANKMSLLKWWAMHV